MAEVSAETRSRVSVAALQSAVLRTCAACSRRAAVVISRRIPSRRQAHCRYCGADAPAEQHAKMVASKRSSKHGV